MSSRRALGWIAAGAVGGAAAIYAIAAGTEAGRRLDHNALLVGLDSIPRVEEASSGIVHTIDTATLALAGIGIAAFAVSRGRRRQAVAALALIAGANLTTQLLKHGLAQADPLGGEAARAAEGALNPGIYPSGHATVAMSLALAATLVVPPGARGLVAAAGATYTAAMGVSLVALENHFPSDVVGGYLVAIAWWAGVAAVLWPFAAEDQLRFRRSPALYASALTISAVLGVGAAVGAQRRPELALYGRLHTTFVAAELAIAACAIAAVAGAVWITTRSSRRNPRAATSSDDLILGPVPPMQAEDAEEE